MNLYQRVVLSIGRTRAFAWLGPRLFHPLDRFARVHPIPDTTIGTTLPLVYLTTTGRRSGRPHIVPLLGIPSDEGLIVVAGTNWGQDQDPSWVLNLRANPDATLEPGGDPIAVRARALVGEEWDHYWARCNGIWPAYEQYRRRSGRDIALFILEPVM